MDGRRAGEGKEVTHRGLEAAASPWLLRPPPLPLPPTPPSPPLQCHKSSVSTSRTNNMYPSLLNYWTTRLGISSARNNTHAPHMHVSIHVSRSHYVSGQHTKKTLAVYSLQKLRWIWKALFIKTLLVCENFHDLFRYFPQELNFLKKVVVHPKDILFCQMQFEVFCVTKLVVTKVWGRRGEEGRPLQWSRQISYLLFCPNQAFFNILSGD